MNGNDLRQARKRLGISTAEAARRAGVSQPYWSQIETGDRDPFAAAERQTNLIERLSRAVGIPAGC